MSDFTKTDEPKSATTVTDSDILVEDSQTEGEMENGTAEAPSNAAPWETAATEGTSDFDTEANMGEPIDPPLYAGDTPNSTMGADLGPAPAESFTNTGVGGAIGGFTENKPMSTEPISSEPLSDINLPYNTQDTPSEASDSSAPKTDTPAPVALSDLKPENLKESAGQAADAAKEKAGQVVSQVKETAGQAIEQAKGQVWEQLGQQKEKAADSLTGLTTSVQQFGDTFRQNNLPQLAGYTDSLADQVDRIAGYIKENDVDVLVRDAEKFAKENAGAFIAGAFILGVALGRFLRASQRNASPSTALVPVGENGQPYYGTTMPTERQDINNDDSIAPGQKPLHAQGYVPGGVVGGAPA